MARSPRFAFRFTGIKPLLEKIRLKSIWKSHIRAANREQIVYDICDYYDVHLNIDHYIDIVSKSLSLGTYSPSSYMRVTLEKSKGLCRTITVPNPVDSLVLQSLVNSIMNALISNQPSGRAFYQPQSHRFTRDRAFRIQEGEYGSLKSWLAFQKEIFKFTEDYKYIVVTDIANFFDSIDYSQLKNVVLSTDGVRENVLDLILYIFEHYCWRPDYMPHSMRGIPQMNFDAPRLLAHTMLYELDRYLSEYSTIQYVRFMDDIDVGVNDVGTAKRILRNIDHTLHTRGLRLNSGKTRIMSAEEAVDYYFVNDNWKLDTVENFIISKEKRIKDIDKEIHLSREIRFIKEKFSRDSKRSGYFEKGNGDKVLKRYFGYAQKYGFPIDFITLKKAIFEKPSLRDMAFRYVALRGYEKDNWNLIKDFVLSQHCVDDASNYLFAKTTVDLNIPNTRANLKTIREIADQIAARGAVGFASSLWLLSKYGTQTQLMNTLISFSDVWFNNEWLGRQAGAMYSRLRSNRKIFYKFRELIISSRNQGAINVVGFHSKIMRGEIDQRILVQYLCATSTSAPRGITHAKILLTMSALRSDMPAASKKALQEAYRKFSLDSIQRNLLRGLI